MNILFIFSRHSENRNDSTLTKDLADEFYKQGANVNVVTIIEKKYGKETENKLENGYEVLRIKTENYFNVKNKFEKGISILKIPYDIKKGILKYLGNKKFDLIITHTPFFSSEKIIKPLKEYFKCPAYLILWDIFPQNAVDIGLIQNKLIYKFFKKSEKNMLLAYNKIFCMSSGNVKYMEENYSFLDRNNIELLKNWAKIKPLISEDKENIRKKYGYTVKDFIAVFGGNMGKPQKLENILELAHRLQEYKNIKFLFIGNGTEKERLEEIVKSKLLTNTQFFNQIPRLDYEILVSACDLGLVSLDERFTVPNFPSKTTDYFKLGLPIFASLDQCSSEDYGKFLTTEAKAGVYGQAGNINDLKQKFLLLYNDQNLRQKLGNNGRYYYENNLSVEKAYDTIMNELMNLNKGV